MEVYFGTYWDILKYISVSEKYLGGLLYFGLFNKIYSVLTLSIVTQLYFIPTSRDRTPTNLGRALKYVTGPYVNRTGHQ
ncbi:hypothetical protein Hanom_Chr00s154753g01823211 [Helianthus anomalus]